jgi:transcriptional regulator with XRE-family HTH domain
MKNSPNKNQKVIELGNRIGKAIEKSGKNQAEFASLLGIFPPNLTRWIQGENAPSFEYLVKIGKFLDVSLDWLLLGKEEPEEETILIAKSQKPEYKTPNANRERRLPENTRKRRLINNVIKILDNENKKAAKALETNIDAFLSMIEQGKSELKEGD